MPHSPRRVAGKEPGSATTEQTLVDRGDFASSNHGPRCHTIRTTEDEPDEPWGPGDHTVSPVSESAARQPQEPGLGRGPKRPSRTVPGSPSGRQTGSADLPPPTRLLMLRTALTNKIAVKLLSPGPSTTSTLHPLLLLLLRRRQERSRVSHPYSPSR